MSTSTNPKENVLTVSVLIEIEAQRQTDIHIHTAIPSAMYSSY